MIALRNQADQWHEDARLAYDDLKQARMPVFTTAYVLLECGNAAARRPFRSAVKQWREALAANSAIIDPSDEDRSEAWTYSIAVRREVQGSSTMYPSSSCEDWE
jgi:hypothetical protein